MHSGKPVNYLVPPIAAFILGGESWMLLETRFIFNALFTSGPIEYSYWTSQRKVGARLVLAIRIDHDGESGHSSTDNSYFYKEFEKTTRVVHSNNQLPTPSSVLPPTFRSSMFGPRSDDRRSQYNDSFIKPIDFMQHKLGYYSILTGAVGRSGMKPLCVCRTCPKFNRGGGLSL
ncbi:hypothetical protein BSLG_000234 [Batrachochytrium salamandrivorans]|nr:hypothetical protein BSLG_000234 [Batrachochytrium salamandrivorans]